MKDFLNKMMCNQWKQIVEAPNGKWYIITFNIDGTFSYGKEFNSKKEAIEYSWNIL